MKPFKYIGSVSHGTLRPEDLIPAFIDILERLNPDDAEEFKMSPEMGDFIEGETYQCIGGVLRNTEHLSDEIEALVNCLNDCAPPYFYFGAHPGDGSDFGFWFDQDAFDRAVQDREVYKTDDPPDWQQADFSMLEIEPDYIAVVSDHGNVTLFTVEGEELWAIV